MVSSVPPRQKTQKTVKAFENDIALINERARQEGCSAAEVIHGMCEELRKLIYLQELGDSLDVSRGDLQRFGEFEAEQRLWDCTLSDGLNDAS
jgi:hypothetical protein